MAKAVCAVDGCTDLSSSRGWCGKHYMRWKTHGDPLVILSNYGVPVRERVLSKVMVDRLGCWLWLGQTDINGYAIVKMDGKSRKAHRVSYELFVGPISEGLQIDHLCRVHSCVNPTHLEPVTPGENQARGLNGTLKTHCRNGHPYTSENVRLNSKGRRMCCICNREAFARYKRKKRAERTRANDPQR